MRVMTSVLSSLAIAASIAAGAATASTVTSGIGGLAVSPPSQTVTANDSVSFSGIIVKNDGSVDFVFEALEDIDIVGFSVNASGLLADLPRLTLALSNGVSGDSAFSVTANPNAPTQGNGEAFFSNFSMLSGDVVTLTFTEASTLQSGVSLGLTFSTTAVPLPAGLPMLVLALGGLAMLPRRSAGRV